MIIALNGTVGVGFAPSQNLMPALRMEQKLWSAQILDHSCLKSACGTTHSQQQLRVEDAIGCVVSSQWAVVCGNWARLNITEQSISQLPCIESFQAVISAFLVSISNGPVLLQLFILKVAWGNFRNSSSNEYVLRKVPTEAVSIVTRTVDL